MVRLARVAVMDEKHWTLDGEPFDIEASDLSEEDRAFAEQMEVGDEMLVGGGAFAEFVLARVA